MADRSDLASKAFREYTLNKSWLAVRDDTPCGCVYCLQEFLSGDVSQWTWDMSPQAETWLQHTALCPKCGVDAVVRLDGWYSELSGHALLVAAHDACFLPRPVPEPVIRNCEG
jgi:hypothetical protein